MGRRKKKPTAIAGGVRRHSARLLSEWLRLARGTPESTGRWLDRNVEVDESIAVLEEAARRSAVTRDRVRQPQ